MSFFHFYSRAGSRHSQSFVNQSVSKCEARALSEQTALVLREQDNKRVTQGDIVRVAVKCGQWRIPLTLHLHLHVHWALPIRKLFTNYFFFPQQFRSDCTWRNGIGINPMDSACAAWRWNTDADSRQPVRRGSLVAWVPDLPHRAPPISDMRVLPSGTTFTTPSNKPLASKSSNLLSKTIWLLLTKPSIAPLLFFFHLFLVKSILLCCIAIYFYLVPFIIVYTFFFLPLSLHLCVQCDFSFRSFLACCLFMLVPSQYNYSIFIAT